MPWWWERSEVNGLVRAGVIFATISTAKSYLFVSHIYFHTSSTSSQLNLQHYIKIEKKHICELVSALRPQTLSLLCVSTGLMRSVFFFSTSLPLLWTQRGKLWFFFLDEWPDPLQKPNRVCWYPAGIIKSCMTHWQTVQDNPKSFRMEPSAEICRNVQHTCCTREKSCWILSLLLDCYRLKLSCRTYYFM